VSAARDGCWSAITTPRLKPLHQVKPGTRAHMEPPDDDDDWIKVRPTPRWEVVAYLVIIVIFGAGLILVLWHN